MPINTAPLTSQEAEQAYRDAFRALQVARDAFRAVPIGADCSKEEIVFCKARATCDAKEEAWTAAQQREIDAFELPLFQDECAIIVEAGEFKTVPQGDVTGKMKVLAGGSRKWCRDWIASKERQLDFEACHPAD